ncbi:MAG TPA: hypothetical protein PKO30_15270, partial [Prolixibacteraceae bacterium]|nr:hypothetical protein [Prolixibacteraceae bacterium]
MKTLKSAFLVTGLCLILFLSSFQQTAKSLKEGIWRGVYTVPGNEIPFLFEVKANSVFLINGEDRFQAKNLAYRNDSV